MTQASVHGLPRPEVEGYVSRVQLAEHMGVSTKTIDRMVAAGMPSVVWMRRTRRFKASVAVAWANSQSRKEME